jgi:hypothetical protein
MKDEALLGCALMALAQTPFVKLRCEQLAEHTASLQKSTAPPFDASQPATCEPEGESAWHTPAPSEISVGAGPVQPDAG